MTAAGIIPGSQCGGILELIPPGGVRKEGREGEEGERKGREGGEKGKGRKGGEKGKGRREG